MQGKKGHWSRGRAGTGQCQSNIRMLASSTCRMSELETYNPPGLHSLFYGQVKLKLLMVT